MNFDINNLNLMFTVILTLSPLVLLSGLIMSYNYLVINSKKTTEERKEKRIKSNALWYAVFNICLVIMFVVSYVYVFIR